MENQEMEESKAPHSSGTNICSRNKGMQIPCKGQKRFKNAKVKFLTMEEVIKLGSAAQTAKRVSHSKRSSQSKPSESLPAISKRTRTVAKTAASKCQSVTEDKKCSSTVFHQQGIKLKREDDSRPKKEEVLGLNRDKGRVTSFILYFVVLISCIQAYYNLVLHFIAKASSLDRQVELLASNLSRLASPYLGSRDYWSF